MNFFERQQQVRRLSFRLVVLFVIAVIGIVVVVDLAVLVATLYAGDAEVSGNSVAGVLVAASAVTLVVIAMASLLRMLGLRGGGGKVARSLGGVLVPEDTTDVRLRRLRNVVEEMSIASGVPVPEVYVLPHEAGINAFAAGHSPADAAIAVTHGALERLNRDELQGVIAHEFSHVINGDMRLNVRLMGLLFGILVLAVIGRILLHVRGRNPLVLVGIALLITGYFGVFIGRIIKAAVSRQREYLADASAVQFTRQTAGLTGALKKIGGLPDGSVVANPKGEEVSHMLFGAGTRKRSWFDTHPPLLQRIKVLDPSVDIAQLQQLSRQWASAPPSGLAEDRALGLAGPGDALPAADTAVPVRPAAVAAAVGTQTPAAQRQAGAIIGQIPQPFLDRARGQQTVVALVFGLLLSTHQETRARQHQLLTARHGADVADAARRDADALAGLHPMLRLPLSELAFPALRRRPRPEQDAVLASVHALARVDGQLSVFEYCLSRLLHRELHEAVHHNSPWRARRQSLLGNRDAVATLLATLASAGHTDQRAAAAAFQAGMDQVLPNQQLPYAQPPSGVLALERVWPALDGLAPGDKSQLVQSMVAVAGHDGTMTVTETELLRTICAVLHCPLPPLGPWDGAAQ